MKKVKKPQKGNPVKNIAIKKGLIKRSKKRNLENDLKKKEKHLIESEKNFVGAKDYI